MSVVCHSGLSGIRRWLMHSALLDMYINIVFIKFEIAVGITELTYTHISHCNCNRLGANIPQPPNSYPLRLLRYSHRFGWCDLSLASDRSVRSVLNLIRSELLMGKGHNRSNCKLAVISCSHLQKSILSQVFIAEIHRDRTTQGITG